MLRQRHRRHDTLGKERARHGQTHDPKEKEAREEPSAETPGSHQFGATQERASACRRGECDPRCFEQRELLAAQVRALVAQGRLDDLVGDVEGIVLELAEIDDVPGSIDAVAARLRAAGLSVTHEEGLARMEVLGASSDDIADAVRDAVADSRARVRRIEQRRRRLEDLFEAVEA